MDSNLSSFLLGFFETIGVVSIIGAIAALCVAITRAVYDMQKVPMIIKGEYRSYINRIRY